MFIILITYNIGTNDKKNSNNIKTLLKTILLPIVLITNSLVFKNMFYMKLFHYLLLFLIQLIIFNTSQQKILIIYNL